MELTLTQQEQDAIHEQMALQTAALAYRYLRTAEAYDAVESAEDVDRCQREGERQYRMAVFLRSGEKLDGPLDASDIQSGLDSLGLDARMREETDRAIIKELETEAFKAIRFAEVNDLYGSKSLSKQQQADAERLTRMIDFLRTGVRPVPIRAIGTSNRSRRGR